jgi:hypothetical protein
MTDIRWGIVLGIGAAALASSGECAADTDVVAPWPRVGGHVGVVLPLFTADRGGTHAIGDFVTIAIASGVTVKLTDAIAVDFEDVVGEPLKPKGQTTGITIDPGVIYDTGPVAIGLRVAYAVGQPPNIGLIPLVHRGFAIGRASWFVEADFPVADQDGDASFTAAFHTGVAF